MGRVTVFAISDCRHCRRVKAALTKRGIPYTEISLSSHPYKRNDMLSLSDRLTVPQVFFNETYIGGADDTIALLEQWDDEINNQTLKSSSSDNSSSYNYASVKERFQHEIASQPDPTDVRLAIPTTPPSVVVEQPASPSSSSQNTKEQRVVRLPNGTASMTSVLQMTTTLKYILPRQTLKYNLTLYKNAFRGSDAVHAIMKYYDLSSRYDALQFGRYLQQHESKLLHHVSSPTKTFQDSDNLYFRLQCYQQPNVLNSFRIWTTTTTTEEEEKQRVLDDDDLQQYPMNVLKRLKATLSKVETAITDETTGLVDYRSAYKNELYPTFEEAVCELQVISMENMNDKTKLAFGINLYNLMITYAFMKVGIPTSTLARGAFFSNVKFNVGGDVMSFNDLENGVLRANSTPPFSLFVPFGKKDPRRRLALDRVDCRIHFALNCGAKSCPPVKNFTAIAIDEELRIVAQAFMEQDDNVRLVPEKNEIYLNMILNWYGIDFAPSKDLLPQAVVSFLRGGKQRTLQAMIDSGNKISVNFNIYDWSTNASDFVPFDSSVLKANTKSIKAVF